MKKFSVSLKGYNINEVNAFVNDVTKEYESMLNNLKNRDEQIKSLKEELIKYQNMENTLNKALLVAEDASNQIKKVASEESRRVIEEARRNASRIVNEALIKAEKLETDGENLRKRIVVFKRRFKSVIETELETIDSIDEDF